MLRGSINGVGERGAGRAAVAYLRGGFRSRMASQMMTTTMTALTMLINSMVTMGTMLGRCWNGCRQGNRIRPRSKLGTSRTRPGVFSRPPPEKPARSGLPAIPPIRRAAGVGKTLIQRRHFALYRTPHTDLLVLPIVQFGGIRMPKGMGDTNKARCIENWPLYLLVIFCIG